MSKIYDEYIMEHKYNVLRGFEWMHAHMSGITSEKTWELAEYLCANMHDYSKNSEEEYDAYDRYFYGSRSYENTQEFNKAWLHHIHNNPHHWQHWILIQDDKDKGMVCLDMPDEYIIEMVCDWWSFSWKQQNLMEIFNWYDERKDYIQLSVATRAKVELILKTLKESLESKKESVEAYLYVDPLRDKE